MATIINNPPGSGNSNNDSGAGFLVGIVLLIIFVAAFFIYGLPYLRDRNSGGTQINIPDEVNVDVNGNNK
jgi:hypothetical protein